MPPAADATPDGTQQQQDRSDYQQNDPDRPQDRDSEQIPNGAGGGVVIVLGVILLVVGYLLGIPILWTIGIILVVVGAILLLLGSVGRGIGGRRHYY